MLLLPCGILDLHKIIVACVPSVKNYRNTRHGPFFPPWNRYIRVLITEPSPHFSIFFSFHPPFSPSLSLSSFQRGNLSPLITRSRKFVHISVSHPPPTPCQPPFPSLPYPHPFLSSPCVPYKGDVEQWEKDREIRGIWAEGCGGWPSKDVVIYIRRIIRIYIYIRRRVVGILFKSLCCPAHTLHQGGGGGKGEKERQPLELLLPRPLIC